MLPPLPRSPPLGPPRGTYFSRRNATQPLPPSPAFTKIFASSTNTAGELRTPRKKCVPRINEARESVLQLKLVRRRNDANKPPATALVFELHMAGDEREQRVVLALTHVFAGLMLRAPLANENRACIDELAAETLYAK